MQQTLTPTQHVPAPRLAPSAAPSADRFETRWATCLEEVRMAQRLRYRVFAQEMGVHLPAPRGTPQGHDVDRFDDFCEHVLVLAWQAEGAGPQVVGTYRVLTPEAAVRAGGCYSETEFDMGRLAPLRPRMVELGRSCVDPQWRSGGVILALWSALGEFMLARGLDIAFGCASIDLKDGGHRAATIWQRLAAQHLAPDTMRTAPLHPLPLEGLRKNEDAPMPPLIKGYLRCGAELLGPPAWDPQFNTADLPMLMELHSLPARHRRRFAAGT